MSFRIFKVCKPKSGVPFAQCVATAATREEVAAQLVDHIPDPEAGIEILVYNEADISLPLDEFTAPTFAGNHLRVVT